MLLEDLGELLVIDKHTLRAYVRRTDTSDFPAVTLALPPSGGLFAIRTGITTYGKYELLDYESGLTNPEIIGRFPDEEGMPECIHFTYQVEPFPFLRLAYPALVPNKKYENQDTRYRDHPGITGRLPHCYSAAVRSFHDEKA